MVRSWSEPTTTRSAKSSAPPRIVKRPLPRERDRSTRSVGRERGGTFSEDEKTAPSSSAPTRCLRSHLLMGVVPSCGDADPEVCPFSRWSSSDRAPADPSSLRATRLPPSRELVAERFSFARRTGSADGGCACLSWAPGVRRDAGVPPPASPRCKLGTCPRRGVAKSSITATDTLTATWSGCSVTLHKPSRQKNPYDCKSCHNPECSAHDSHTARQGAGSCALVEYTPLTVSP